MSRRRLIALAAIVSAFALVAGCSSNGDSSSGGSDNSAELSIVAYSTPEQAYGELTTAFQATPRVTASPSRPRSAARATRAGPWPSRACPPISSSSRSSPT